MNISDILIKWYRENRRDLPWRNTTDPYLIWISEIILQQTRVAQGLSYFYRFTERFPDIRTLAEAQEDEVLKYWQGLGYYSRARNIHAAACDIMERFGGIFPTSHKDILSLKGIGEYTAAAVCSFAWKQPYAVLDGNVFRVLARLFAVGTPINSGAGKKYFAELAQELLDLKHPGLHNQAIMDFGALQCLPQSPDCITCPLQSKCIAYASAQVDRFPVKQGKTVVKPRYFNYFHIHCKNEILLSKRIDKDIWQNLYEFPLIETPETVELEELQQNASFRKWFEGAGDVKILRTVQAPKHVLSHRIIYACFYEIEVSRFSAGMNIFHKISSEHIQDYAVSRLISLYLER